jgi:hypothetical protein
MEVCVAGLLAKLRGFLLREEPRPEQTPAQAAAATELIGAEFRRKHTNFRLLLTSGKRLLSILADMERATTDGRVFGMAFLRAGTTSAAVNAFRMLSHLKSLDPGAAKRLSDRFTVILAGVEEVLGRRNPLACGDMVTNLAVVDAQAADLVGSRLAELGEVKNRLGLPVPNGFVIGACGYEAFAGQTGLREEIARRTQSMYAAVGQHEDDGNAPPALFGPDAQTLAAMSREIQALILAAPLPEALAQAIDTACAELTASCGSVRLCLLPNSLGEAQGFTGVYPAQFGVPCSEVKDAYRRACAGKYSVQAMRRRLMGGIPDIDVALCVGVLAVPRLDPEQDLGEDPGRVLGEDGERLRGACRTCDPGASARNEGLGAEDAKRLAELSRGLEQGLGAPALFEWVKGPDGGFQVLRCGPLPPPDEEEERANPPDALQSPDAQRMQHTHMEGSPVHQRLVELLAHLAPLTLPAPEDPDFRAVNCKTVRDVARLAHQRAVDAMVEFGRGQQDFSERQAKQLWAGDAAMQWWIINLEDAFSGPPEGKFIRLENIASPPFQAVWQGISAVPWAGPPPVDARGFLSIMYESTTNPEISITSEFDFGVQNHILLSRSYVSLSSRFGYHFVTIEALVGERARENFVSFQFRGGATEVTRRTRRIRFVAGILSEFGFSLETSEDALMARVEGLTTPELMDRLRVLGYLIIHTRQLDMVMRIPEQVRLHREKILREIRQMLGHPPGHPSDHPSGPLANGPGLPDGVQGATLPDAQADLQPKGGNA